MTVKWVCSDCDSNNIGEKRGILRCEVCGKPRMLEKLVPVDTSILCEIPDERVFPAINGGQLVRLLAVTIVRWPSALLIALLIVSAAAVMLAFYQAGMEQTWARIIYNVELLEFHFNWDVIHDILRSLLSRIGRVPGNILALLSLACSASLRCLSNLRVFWDPAEHRMEWLVSHMLRNRLPVWEILLRILQNLGASAYAAWDSVKALLYSGTAWFARLLDKMI